MDAAKVLEKTMSDPRFTRGQALLKEKRLEEAVVVYEDLLQTMIETENEADSLVVAPVYYQYGHALLSLAEATANVFGSSVQEQREEAGDIDAEQDARNTADDLEVAWEMLEVARVIYSRYPDELAVEKELARVYMRLGDLGMESDVFSQARSDYEKSLMLRQKVLKATNDPDTTPLADLYCCLAISCIYHDASTDKKDGTDEQAPASAVASPEDVSSVVDREAEGRKYYVLAGHVMAENIHSLAAKCPAPLQEFVERRIPKYSSSISNSNEIEKESAPTITTPKGKGKQKARVETHDRELLFTNEPMDSLRNDFLACVEKYKSSNDAPTAQKDEGAVTDSNDNLTKNEAQLLEYLEIYIELKEKVDAINESTAAEPLGASNTADTNAATVSKEQEGPVTTTGFGNPNASSAATATILTAKRPNTSSEPTVNVISVVKKRKITPETQTVATSTSISASVSTDSKATTTSTFPVASEDTKESIN